jgi:hypothetical protein
VYSLPVAKTVKLDETQMNLHWETISNQHAIEVNQDYAGFSGSRFGQSSASETFYPCDWGPSVGKADASCEWPKTWSWYKPLSGRDGRKSTMAVLLMNNGNETNTVGFEWGQVPGMSKAISSCEVFDVWSGKSLGVLKGVGYTAKDLGPRNSAFLTLSACK